MKTTIPVYVGQDAIAHLARYCADHRAKRFTLVADQNTYAALGRSVESALVARGLEVCPIVLAGEEIVADEQYIVQVLVRASAAEQVFLAVGSGTVTDITRFCSHRTRSTFISIPTAPSVDGYASGSSSLAIGGLKQTVRAHPPVAIFADLPVLAAAPRALIAAGFGDMLGKFTALADWQLGRLLWNEPYDQPIAQRSREALLGCVSRVAGIGQASAEGIRHLMQGLVETGLCMLDAGYSAPAAGAEHYLSHFWETKLLREHRRAILHGAKVGVATVLMAGLYDSIKRLSCADVAKRLAGCAPPARLPESQRIRDAYGPIADQVIAEQAPFLNLADQPFENLKQRILENWAGIQDIAASVPPAGELAGLLDQVGGPVEAAALGLQNGEAELGMQVGHYFRNRFTVVKLGRMLGLPSLP